MAVCCAMLVFIMFGSGVTSAADGSPSIVINIAARTLSHYTGGVLVKEYPIAIGKPSTPSPLGEFEVIEKIINPWWFPTTPGMEPVPSGPANPLGYRWIGFASTYGVHGTNMPWSVGTAASKGCIRMLEEDVEELFPHVFLGTPVTIIYDTIRTAMDKQGCAYITVYEDAYDYGTTTASRLQQKIADLGVQDLVNTANIYDLLHGELGKPQLIGQVITLKLNGRTSEQKGIIINDIILIPYTALSQSIGLNAEINYATGSIVWQGLTMQGEFRQSGLYLRMWDLCTLLGAEGLYDQTTATASVEVTRVSYNGKPLWAQVRRINGIIALPVQTLLSATGRNEELRVIEQNITVAGRKIPAVLYGDTPYIQITRLQEALNIYVYYDTQSSMISLTSIPFASGGS